MASELQEMGARNLGGKWNTCSVETSSQAWAIPIIFILPVHECMISCYKIKVFHLFRARDDLISA